MKTVTKDNSTLKFTLSSSLMISSTELKLTKDQWLSVKTQCKWTSSQLNMEAVSQTKEPNQLNKTTKNLLWTTIKALALTCILVHKDPRCKKTKDPQCKKTNLSSTSWRCLWNHRLPWTATTRLSVELKSSLEDMNSLLSLKMEAVTHQTRWRTTKWWTAQTTLNKSMCTPRNPPWA